LLSFTSGSMAFEVLVLAEGTSSKASPRTAGHVLALRQARLMPVFPVKTLCWTVVNELVRISTVAEHVISPVVLSCECVGGGVAFPPLLFR
jgi:hypothetical protein